MSWRPSIQHTTRHWSGASLTPAVLFDDVVVAQSRHALERAERGEDELPLVDPPAALHDHRLDVHLDEDVLVGDGLVGLEGEVAVDPAEEVEGDVFDLVAHGLLERGRGRCSRARSRIEPMRPLDDFFFCSASAARSCLLVTWPDFTRRSPSGMVPGWAVAK